MPTSEEAVHGSVPVVEGRVQILPVTNALSELGRHIALARRRRRLTQRSLAGRMQVGLSTVQRLEAGSGTVALEVLARALFILGELEQLKDILASRNDALGLMLADEQLPKRIRRRRQTAAL